jgi:hypothetical protein
MRFFTFFSVNLLFSLSLWGQSQHGITEAWQGFSDPEIMSSGFSHLMHELPLEGSLQIGPKVWSGHYWPSKKGGINHRWNSPNQEGFDYKSPTKEELLIMVPEDIATLAPSEKYDLFIGRYDYPLKKKAASSASKLAADWEGICHGWAPAAIHHHEPTPKLVKNPDGIIIPFGSSDIKALLSYYYAFYHKSETNQVGLRCFFGNWVGGARGCGEDLNAGAFHIILANKIGIQREGFLMDIDRYREVWNQPVTGYRSKILASRLKPSKKAAKTAVSEMRIATKLFYLDESDPTWHIVMGTEYQIISKRDLLYRIELDASGKIVGGEWESEVRPDFLWNKKRAENFDGLLFKLGELLND